MGDDKQFNVDKTSKVKDMVEPRYICQRCVYVFTDIAVTL